MMVMTRIVIRITMMMIMMVMVGWKCISWVWSGYVMMIKTRIRTI